MAKEVVVEMQEQFRSSAPDAPGFVITYVFGEATDGKWYFRRERSEGSWLGPYDDRETVLTKLESLGKDS